MSLLQNSNAISSGSYDINNSLRFRNSASASLSRTPASAGNRKTWTWSGWIKRGPASADRFIFGSNTNLPISGFFFGSDNTLKYRNYNGSIEDVQLFTTPVFRDPSAWYHLVVVLDTTQATASNRLKFYINGVQITAFGTATYPSLNSDQGINDATAHDIGSYALIYSNFDGYMAEINFVNGQALTPSSFGETDTTTGSWKPKAYSGTYGTNGFYLKFSDIATTSGSNAGLGKDFSGNANYWTTNNISVTAGTTYDAMIDSPTLTSATVANYCTLNPVLQNGWWAAPNRGTISNGNLTHSSGGNTTAFGNFDFVSNSGKWYYEVTCGATDSNNTLVIAALSRSTFEVGYYQSGQKQINGATPTSYGSSWTSGDVIGIAIDVPNNTITFYKNNVSQGAITNTFPTGQPVYGGSYYNSTSGDYNYNFGQRPFSYTPPTGFVALNTYNLPDSTIKKGNTVMDATTYTGTGSSLAVANAAGFKPDFVWGKDRGQNQSHLLFDSIRGVHNFLISNSTAAQDTNNQTLTGFNSNGFQLGTNGTLNQSSQSFVAWQWQAGQGSTSSNTSGTITSTVSVNTTAGFSVVTYTGTGANATVGHGLGVAPKMIIVKNRSNGGAGDGAWQVYHTSIGAANYLVLNTTAASAAGSTRWQSTTPTSSVFYIGATGSVNNSAENYVAYCWAEIAGFSKFGSYTGNGSADGTFIYTGFRPKFIIIKQSSAAGEQWIVWDSVRTTYNIMGLYLHPSLSNAESTFDALDFLSNGFKIRVNHPAVNTSSATYIYMAFAENPTKYALAR